MKDFYKILGVQKNASVEDIKKNYLKLAHVYHPDKTGGDDEKFREVNEAYQTLSDYLLRQDYDRQYSTSSASQKSSHKESKASGHQTHSTRQENPKGAHSGGTLVEKYPKFFSIMGSIIFIITIKAFVIAFSDTTPPESLEIPSNNNDVTVISSVVPTQLEEKVFVKEAVVPVQKTANQICKDEYGLHSFSTGKKTVDGGPICDCESGYEWNPSEYFCIAIPVKVVKTNDEICKDMNGPYGIYESSSNICGCQSGYYYGVVSKQCVSLVESRNQSCANSYPGTSFLKMDAVSGKNICDCVLGSEWNNEHTACFTISQLNQSCINAYGTGSISTTENGKRVCDCKYGYSWDLQRSACITTASINAICERDVGRNSRYSGTVANGKYECTEPY